MKSKKLEYIILFYVVIHWLYSIYMFTQSLSYGAIWLAIALVESILFYVGCRKWNVLKTVLMCVLVLQSALSLGIVLGGNDTNIEDADFVLVLGYQLDNNEMSETLKLRLDKAYEYAMNNPYSTFVLCGGVTRENTISEAEIMRRYLSFRGLNESRIVCEDQSTNTIENIQNSLEYVRGDSKIVVVSSNYHVARAKMICESVGLNVKGIGSKAPILLIPNQCLFEKISMLRLLLNI